MEWMVAALAVLLVLFVGIIAREARPRCLHHWHPADAMIAWECCHCHTSRDGWPNNGTNDCSLQ